MQLDQLQNFCVVAKSASISKAAQQLHMSQPNLSRSISNLEKELGQPLFHRIPSGLTLTDTGKFVLNRAQQIIDLVESTRALITDDGQSGIIRIGAIPTIAPYFLPGFLKKIADEFPASTLHVNEEVTSRLLERLNLGEIDIAIMAHPVDAKYLEVIPLFKEELYLLTTIEHPLFATHRTGQQMELNKLAEYPFIMLDQEHCLSDQITSFCRQKSFQPLLLERASQLTTIQELVSLGHGISLVPDMARQCDHDHLRHYIRLKNPQPTRTIVMVTNTYRFQSKLLKACLKSLKKYGDKWPKRNA